MNAARMTRRWHLGKVSIALGVLLGGSLLMLAATRVMGVPAPRTVVEALPSPARSQAPVLTTASTTSSRPAHANPLAVAVAALPSAASLDPTQARTPEARLIAAYRLVAQSRLDEALKTAAGLVGDLPNFRLAQLLYGDLLMVRSGLSAPLGSAAPAGGEDLTALRQEAQLRLAALRERPPADTVPAPFVKLPSSVKHAIAVDVSRARLYLFAHENGQLRLISDHYVSVGKQGVDKLVEGDQRTPLGAYLTLESIDRRLLEDRFGSGALPLNYPNAFDRARGRTGSGILLHGVSSDSYVRAPQATDGCVAMANDDLLEIASTINPRYTPVVIARRVDWVAPQQAQAGGEGFMDQWQAWQQARVTADAGTLGRFYDRQSIEPPASAPVLAFPGRGKKPARTVNVAGFDDLSVLAVRDERPMMVVSYRERGANGERSPRLKQQYWAQESGRWKIVAES